MKREKRKMINRIPPYFELKKFGISPADIVKLILGCDAISIRSEVIVMPNWKADIFKKHADSVEIISERKVYQIKYRRKIFTLIRSGIGAPLTGDVILALGCTACKSIILTGSGKQFKKNVNLTNRLPESISPGRGNLPPEKAYLFKLAS